MRQATSLKDFRNTALLPGSLINTSPTDYRVVKYMRLERFNGKTWEYGNVTPCSLRGALCATLA